MPTVLTDELAPLRESASHRLAELLHRIRESNPSIATYLVGSVTHEGTRGPKDIDVLFVDLANESPAHENDLRKLKCCLREGSPFEGAFDACHGALRVAIEDVLEELRASASPIRITATFAFGPARGEVSVPDDALHVHVCGPLAVGDLAPLRTILPFHAAEFCRYNRAINSPDLAALFGKLDLRAEDLVEWDELTFARWVSAQELHLKRKRFLRLLRNRRFVPEYLLRHRGLLEKAERAAEAAPLDVLEQLIHELLSTARALAAPSQPYPPASD